MELNMIFFGKKGISATSVNYVCNYAKELIKDDDMELAEMSRM